MDLWETLRVAARRWYIALPVLLVGLALSLVLSSSVDRTYTARGAVVMTPPSVRVQSGPEPLYNALYELGLDTVANTSSLYLNGGEGRLAVVGLSGGGGNYTIENQNRSPIIRIEARASTDDVAVRTLTAVLDVLDTDLERRQSDVGASAEYRIVATRIVQDRTASPDPGQETKMLLLFGGLSVVGAVLAALAIDWLFWRRDPRRRLAQSTVGTAGVDPLAELTARH